MRRLLWTLAVVCSLVLATVAMTGSSLASGDVGILPVVGVHASLGSDVSNPAYNLVDADLGSTWRSSPGAGSVWAILEFGQAYRIDSARIYAPGPVQGDLKIEYQDEGVWRPVAGGAHLSLPDDGGWREVDLSYDGVIAERLRLTLERTGSEPQLGGVGHVEVYGSAPIITPSRQTPVEITGGAETNPALPVANLSDGNTYSRWETKATYPQAASVTFRLSGPTRISLLKFYGSGEQGDALTWEYETNGVWSVIPGLANVPIGSLPRGWHRFDVGQHSITAERLRLTVTNFGRHDKLGSSEVEIWGSREPNTIRSLWAHRTFWTTSGLRGLDAGQPAQSLNVTLPSDLTDFGQAILLCDARDLDDGAELILTVNGATANVEPSRLSPGEWGFIAITLPLSLLKSGLNEIGLSLATGRDGVDIDNARIELMSRDGAAFPFGGGEAADRQALSAWEAITGMDGRTTLELPLPGLWQLEEVNIYLAGRQGQTLDVEYRGGESWLPVPGLTGLGVQGLIENWNAFRVSGAATTNALRLRFTGTPGTPVGKVGEIFVKGSPINIGAPRVRINSPQRGQLVSNPVTVTGTVDNDSATVKVNGVAAKVADGGFAASIEVDVSGPKAERIITAEATDAGGQVGRDEIQVYVNKRPPGFLSLSPADGTLTTAKSITVSGELDDNAPEVTVNGAPADLRGRKFTATIQLQEGINRLKVVATDYFAQSAVSTEVVRTVTRDTTAPRIVLQCPFEGEVVGRQIPLVTGLVEDITPVTVKVNGRLAAVDSGVFQATGITLVEGANVIEVVATDAAGHTTTLKAAVTLDKGAPVLRVDEPVPTQLFNYQPVLVRGTVTDATSTAVYVNGIAAQRLSTAFEASVPLHEGTNTLVTKAIDAADNEASDVRQVVLDTTPPAAFQPVAAPSSWAPVASPIVAFATTDATSGVDHYEVSIDGSAWLRVQNPYAVPAQADGIHTVAIKAVDRAGWSTVGTVKLYVDTVAPQAFTPVADPASWTNNTQPVITFGTVDATSGLDHYELRVDDGTYAPVVSPYQLPAQKDGTHTVYVKAVDQAGLSTVGSVQIFIDTTPPAVPAGVEVIPGPAALTVNWQANTETDLKHYVLKRTPAFSDGTTERIVAKDSAATYRDEDVVLLGSYAYQARAVDHIDNASAFTETFAAQVGIAVTPIDTSQPSEVKFEDVKVEIPPQAISDNGSVTVVALTGEAVPPAGDNVVVGNVLNLDVVESPDEIANPGQVVFNEPVTMTFTYQHEDIPEGMKETDLYVYRFDLGTQSWVRVPGQVLDTEKNTITVPVEHFSMYSIQASAATPPDPATLNGMGVAPYQSYLQENNESVSPASGNLSVRAVDLRLPGRNGLDLEIARTYDMLGTQIATLDSKSGAVFASFAGGWTLDLPWIGTNDNGQFVTVPGGGAYDIKWSMDGSGWGGQSHGTFSYHEGEHFIIEQFQRYVRDRRFLWWKTGEVWEPTHYILTTKDGRQYQIDTAGKPVKLTDRTGQNEIKFNWSGNQLTSIEDTLGRVVNVTYADGKITSIKSDDREIKYTYDSKLATVTDPEGRVTNYAYTSMTAGTVNDSERTYTSLLNRITYPTGGYTSYGYGGKSSGFGSGITRAFVSHKTQYPAEGAQQAFNDTAFSYGWHDERIESSTIAAPSQITEMNFNDKSLATRRVTKDRTKGAIAVEQVDYEYNTALKAVTKESYSKGGMYHETGQYHFGPVFYKTYGYDNWGNLTYEYHSATGLETRYAYANTNSAQGFPAPFASAPFTSGVAAKVYNLVTGQAQLNHDPVRGVTVPVQVHYQYDASGNLVREAKRHDGAWIETAYEYDSLGNVTKKTDPLGRVTRIEYSDAYKKAYPTKVTAEGVKDADDQALPNVATETGYHLATGLKAWEKDGRGYTTSYEYDKLGRLRKTTYPGSGSPVKLADFNDKQNTYTVTDENGNRTTFFYDGLAHLFKVVQYKKSGGSFSEYATTQFAYDAVGNVTGMTDANGKVTSYAYDGLGRLTKTTYPDETPGSPGDNPYSQAIYDDYTNTVTNIDANGHKSVQAKDWADRVTQITQYETQSGDVLYTNIVYDRLGSKLQVTDPRGDVTRTAYDDLIRPVEVIYPAMALVKPGSDTEASGTPRVTYVYDAVNNKIRETSANGNASGQPAKYTATYTYDALNRLVKSVEPFTAADGQARQRVTKTYYDATGNKTKVVDGNGQAATFEYDARKRLTRETDARGFSATHEYDAVGNKIKSTDPRGNATWYVYDELKRLVRGILPDATTPANPYVSAEDNPYVEFTYDLVGNKLTEREPNGSVTTFGYTPRYWLKSVQDAAGAVTTFGYDKVGNQTSITDANSQTTTNVYDDLNRLVKTVNPYNEETTYAYDRAGNRTKEVDTNKHATEWAYNPLKKLIQVKDAKGGITKYQYDPNGNLVAMTDAKDNTTRYEYNELNWLTKETNSLGLATTYAYDLAGNRSGATSPRGVQTSYQYYPNNLLKDVTYSLGDQTERISYEYDQAGNRTRMTDPSGQAVYAYDPLNQVTGLSKLVLGRSYQTEYRYDKAGNVTGIKYPGANAWLEYQYNNVGRVYAITGFADGTVGSPAFAYDGAGNIRSIRLNSGATAAYTPDKLNRLQSVSVTSPQQPTPVLSLAYTYDGEGNILTRNDNTYRYDELDRLVYSQVRGIFADDIPSRKGLITGDFTGQKPVSYGLDEATPASFDYASSSVGLDFGGTAPVRRVYLAKDDSQADTSRVKPSTLDLYAATGNNTDGQDFEKLNPSSYLVQTTLDGYTFTFPNPVYASEFKVHSKFDERNEDNAFADKATFRNTLDEILRAEEEVSQATLEYGYDAVGNRTYERFAKATVHAKTYTYYSGSNRLLSDEKYAFVYDADSNLVKKGNRFTIQGEDVTFTTSGRGVEYWEYGYNLRNQLTQVHKNGQLVATYAYDGLGLRVTATTTISSQVTGESKTTTRDYVFDLADRVIYDQLISTSGQLPANEDPETSNTNSYVFANGTHFAKVEGAIGSGAELYFYHNDHLGSPMAITDSQGNLAWSQDYLPYGEALNESATQTKTRFTFTGKELDPATGLYYYNARWYDADLGRFVTEDTYAGDTNEPQTLNRYVYVVGNPLKFVDPTGHDSTLIYESEGSAYGAVTEDEVKALQHIYDEAGIKESAKTMFEKAGVDIKSAREVAQETYKHTQVLKAFANPKSWAAFVKKHGVTDSNQVLEDALRFIAWSGRVPNGVFGNRGVALKVDGLFPGGERALISCEVDGSVKASIIPRGADWKRAGWAGLDILEGGVETYFGAVASSAGVGVPLVLKGGADVSLGLSELTFALTGQPYDAQQQILGEKGSQIWDGLSLVSNGKKVFEEAGRSTVEVVRGVFGGYKAGSHLGGSVWDKPVRYVDLSH